MFKNLLIHELALTPKPANTDDVERLTERALALGAIGLELVYWPGENLNPRAQAKAVLRAGGKKAAVCTFHPQGEEFGDPCDPKSREQPLSHLNGAIRDAAEMRESGLDVSTVDGPLGFVLGEQKYIPARDVPYLVEFMKLAAEMAEKYKIRLALERLRESEDGIVRSAVRLKSILTEVDSPWVGAHDDTFHAMKNGELPEHSIATLGSKLMHFHANGFGLDSERDGRIPCGCKNYRVGEGYYTDLINWSEVSLALARLRQPADSIMICLEPFSEMSCSLIPPLRNGVIPVTNDAQIAESVKNLFRAGLLQRV